MVKTTNNTSRKSYNLQLSLRQLKRFIFRKSSLQIRKHIRDIDGISCAAYLVHAPEDDLYVVTMWIGNTPNQVIETADVDFAEKAYRSFVERIHDLYEWKNR